MLAGGMESVYPNEDPDSYRTVLEAGKRYSLFLQHADDLRLGVEIVDLVTGNTVQPDGDYGPPHTSPDGYAYRSIEFVAPSDGDYLVRVKGVQPGTNLGQYLVSLDPMDGFSGTGAATGRLGVQAMGNYAWEAEVTGSTTPKYFYIYRRGALDTGTTVNWTLNAPGGTSVTGTSTMTFATAADFTGATAGVVSFRPGEMYALLTVQTLGDASVENNEAFSVSISAPAGYATEGGGAAFAYIRDVTSTATYSETESSTRPCATS